MTPLLCALLVAATPSGLEIAKKAAANDHGYKGQRASATLTLLDPSGSKRVYKLTQLWREGDASGVGTSTLIRFTEPKDVAGTALLTRERAEDDDDRWLYLAATRQLKRIAGSDRSAKFLGSEFSFEDLTYSVLDKYTYDTVGESQHDGRPCWQVERKPRNKASSYSRAVVCHDKEHAYPLNIVFFDPANQPVKEATFAQYTAYGRHFRAHRIEMKNLQSGRRTVYEASGFKLGLTLSPRLFSESQLQKK